MKKYDTIFLDRDGTLNLDPGYINQLDQFNLFETTIPGLKLLSEHGNRFCIVTNQSGINRGIISQEELDEIHSWLSSEFHTNEIELLGIYWNADHPENPTKRRKPGPGMFIEAAEDHNIDLVKSIMIGDSFIDIQSGENLDMDTMLVLTGNGQKTIEEDQCTPTYVVKDLLEGAKLLTEDLK